MILVGSQRGGAGDLARHLMNDRDNDHVELLEVRGFASRDLGWSTKALDAARALAQLDPAFLPPTLRTVHELMIAGIASVVAAMM